MKVCSKCGIEKYNESFYTRKGGKLTAACKDCTGKSVKQYRVSNIEKIRLSRKSYRDTNKYKEKAADRIQRYFLNNRDKANSRLRENNKRYRKELLLPYLNAKLKRQGFTKKMISENPELVELKKVLIKAKRICKQNLNQ